MRCLDFVARFRNLAAGIFSAVPEISRRWANLRAVPGKSFPISNVVSKAGKVLPVFRAY